MNKEEFTEKAKLLGCTQNEIDDIISNHMEKEKIGIILSYELELEFINHRLCLED